ncbi:MAG: hypothetical protein PHX14_06625 [Syntrophomonadaceae bacterium]|nr:hypothetical protein [Syntrophomonadaceae bacterium]
MPGEQAVYRVELNGQTDATALTVSRSLYETGLGDQQVPLHFASYGDPVFDAIL